MQGEINYPSAVWITGAVQGLKLLRVIKQHETYGINTCKGIKTLLNIIEVKIKSKKMKQVILYEREDLDKFKTTAGYYLEGKDGLLDQAKMSVYSHNYERPEQQVKLSEFIAKMNTEDSLQAFKMYFISRIEKQREDISSSEKLLSEKRDELNSMISTLENISAHAKTFSEAFNLIIQP